MTALRLIRDGDPQRPTVDVLDAWRVYMSAVGQATKTVKLRLEVLHGLMAHAGVLDPLELTRDHVMAYLGRDHLSQWSRVTYWRSIKRFQEFLREFGHDPNSELVKGLQQPKQPEPVARPINDTIIERLLSLKLSGRAHVYVRLALYQALRVHEIAKIRGEDFDRSAGWLMVTGKGSITRPIPIHPEVAKICDRMPEIGFWFPATGTIDRPVQPTAVSQTITAALRMAGSTGTAHQLRDTAATRLQRTSKDIRVTQSLLRHRNIASTMKYTAACNEDLENAVRGMTWADTASAQQVQPEVSTVDVSAMSTAQLRDLAAQLVTALAQSTYGGASA